MKVNIILTDDSGKTYSGEVELTTSGRHPQGRRSKPAAGAPPTARREPSIDLSLGDRAFIRRHVTRETSGPRKFVILLAWMAKGNAGKEIAVEDLSKKWAKVKGPMGGQYQTVYATRAKDSGWVDSPKQGIYSLRAIWREAF